VRLADLPAVVDGLPALGLADDTLAPVGFTTEDAFLLIGPPQAYPEQALLAMVQSYQRSRPDSTAALLSLRRSSLANAHGWDTIVRGVDEIRDYLSALGGGAAAPSLLAVDGIVELSNSDVDFDLQTLLKTVLSAGTFAVALGDAFQIGSAFGSAKIFKGYRNGLALLPEQMDGDVAFSTPFPRVVRTDFRAGCGYLVRQGRVRKVLMASPS
jgi:S-DNA-T family DNA segregation ATPase FtsK/SpoIIIE